MQTVRDILKEEMAALIASIQQRITDQGASATGKTAASLQATTDALSATLYGGGGIRFIQRGRGPGPVPADFRSIIRQWITSKGIDFGSYQVQGMIDLTPQQRLDSLAGAIAHTIEKKGTLLYRAGKSRDILDTPIQQTVESVGQKVTDLMAVSVKTMNEGFGNENDDK